MVAATLPDPLAGYEKGRVPRALRERQLLEVAEEVFARVGYQGASLEDVAREAGVTRQYLNKLFGNKEALYLACHRRARDQLDGLLTAVADGFPADPTRREVLDRLRAGAEAYFTFVRDHGRGWDVLFGPGTAVAGPAVAEVDRMRDHTTDILSDLVRRSSSSVDPMSVRLFAQALSGAGDHIARWWRANPGISMDDVVERFVALFWEGVARYAPPE